MDSQACSPARDDDASSVATLLHATPAPRPRCQDELELLNDDNNWVNGEFPEEMWVEVMQYLSEHETAQVRPSVCPFSRGGACLALPRVSLGWLCLLGRSGVRAVSCRELPRLTRSPAIVCCHSIRSLKHARTLARLCTATIKQTAKTCKLMRRLAYDGMIWKSHYLRRWVVWSVASCVKKNEFFIASPFTAPPPPFLALLVQPDCTGRL